MNGETSFGDVLGPDDADQLRDFAVRCARAGRTARRIAPANPEAGRLLLEFAAAAEAAQSAAEAVAALAAELADGP